MAAARFTSFSPKALAFLRALKRNNDREWFRERKDQYELLLKAPMVGLVERLAVDMRTIAPQIVFDAKTAIYRPYRDTRFASDKTPIKTNIAASFPTRGLPRHQGAGLYVEFAAGWLFIGGGMYAPETSQLHAVREHIAVNHRRLRSIIESPGFRKVYGTMSGDRLQRVPRGFAADHPAAEFLKHRQFLAFVEHPAAVATRPTCYATIVAALKQAVPLIGFLNEPLLASAGPDVAAITAARAPQRSRVSAAARDAFGLTYEDE